MAPLELGSVPTLNQWDSIFPALASPAIGTPTPMMAVQQAMWRQVDSLWEGTAGMRLAGEAYLPRQPNETVPNYRRRLARSTLHNYYKSAIRAAVGKVFAKDVVLENASTDMQLVAADVDSQGRNISQFAKAIEEDAVNHGVSFILVDHTRVPSEFVSLADRNASGARPYWVSIPATKVLDARAGTFGGSQRLAYFRYEEEVWEPTPDGFSGSSYRQVRIFKQDEGTPVFFAVYRERNGAAAWERVDAGELVGVSAIPVCPVYTNRTGFFIGKPPLQDLADVNVQHWQCFSDYQNSLHVATIPFMLTKGLKPTFDENGNPNQLEVSINAGIVATDPNASVEWIETTGAALAAAAKNIESLCAEMEKLGMTLCSQQPGGITATEKAVNASEANSTIKTWALALQDALNCALSFTAEFLQDSSACTALVNIDYAVDYASDDSFKDVLEARKLGVIGNETVIAEAQRRKILDPDSQITAPEPAVVAASGASSNIIDSEAH